MTQRPRNTALVNAPTTRGDGQKKELSSAKRRNSTRSGEVHTSSSDAMRKKEQLGTMSQLVGGAAIAVVAILAVLASTSVFEPFRDAISGRGGGTGSVSGSGHGKDDSAAIRLFLEWFDASGGVRHEHIGITSFPAMGKGTKSTHSLVVSHHAHCNVCFLGRDCGGRSHPRTRPIALCAHGHHHVRTSCSLVQVLRSEFRIHVAILDRCVAAERPSPRSSLRHCNPNSQSCMEPKTSYSPHSFCLKWPSTSPRPGFPTCNFCHNCNQNPIPHPPQHPHCFTRACSTSTLCRTSA